MADIGLDGYRRQTLRILASMDAPLGEDDPESDTQPIFSVRQVLSDAERKERRRASWRRWYARNKTKKIASVKARYEANKEEIRARENARRRKAQDVGEVNGYG